MTLPRRFSPVLDTSSVWDCFGLLKRHRQDSSSVGYVPKTLAWLRGSVLEEETQHFLRCVRPLRIRIGAGRAAARQGVAGTVDKRVVHNAIELAKGPRITWHIRHFHRLGMRAAPTKDAARFELTSSSK